MWPDVKPHAAALALWRLKGRRALAYADERIGYLSIVKDARGVCRFRRIRAWLEALDQTSCA